MSKKIISLLLVVVMLLGMISPAAAFTYPAVPTIPGPLNFLSYYPDYYNYTFDSTTPGPKTFIIRPDINIDTLITFELVAITGIFSNAVIRKDSGVEVYFNGSDPETLNVSPGVDLFLTFDYSEGSEIYINIYRDGNINNTVSLLTTHGFRAKFNSSGATSGSPPGQTSVVPFIDMPGPNTMVKDGYDFEGWRLVDATGSWELYTEGQTVLASDLGYFSVEFSPVWTPSVVQKSIAFNSGAATSGTVPDSISCDPGTSITLPTADSYNLFKSGHAHRGWSLSADGTTKDFELGQTLVWTSDRPDAVTLYPYMAPAASVEYTFTAGGGVGLTDSSLLFVGDAYTARASGTLTRGGYHYTQYEVNAPSGIYVNAGESFSLPSVVTELTPDWVPNKYTIQFSQNYGAGTIVETMADVDYGSQITMPAGPVRAGYVFKRWSDNAPMFETTYSPGELAYVERNTTYYAIWEALPNQYTVTYSANGGIGTTPNTVGNVGDTVTLSDGAGITRDGYHIFKWGIVPDGTEDAYYPGDSVSFAEGNHTLYALWRGNNVNLTYYLKFRIPCIASKH